MIVFIHAFPLSAVMWEPLIKELATPTLALNLPGFGGRELPGAAPSLTEFAHDVIQQLQRRDIDVNEVVLAGCSLGGYVVMEMLRQGAQPRAIALMDTKHTADSPEAVARRLHVAQTAEEEGVEALVEQLAVPLLSPNSAHLFEPIRALIRSTPAATLAWTQRAMAVRPDSSITLREFSGPALVVVGAEDALAPVSVAEEMAAQLPHSQMAIIQAAGHLSPWEQPFEVARALTDLI